jgi:hypothetical protein
MKQIAEQLQSKCKPSVFDGWLDADLIDSRRSQEMVSAWAAELEDALNSGDGEESVFSSTVHVEISQHDTKSGHTEYLSVSEDGINVNEMSA